MAQKHTVRLLAKKEVADGTMLFGFEKPEGFAFRAGQNIDLFLPSREGAELKHTFSLVNAPHEDTLAVATRMRDSLFKNTLRDLSDGSAAVIDGPYGSFTLHQNVARPAVFLVGGIGITPFMSMTKDAIHRKLPHRIHLFFSNYSPSRAPFLAELQQLAAEHSSQLIFAPTMTNIAESKELWDGEEGYITWDMVGKYAPEKENAVFYMAGPAGMVAAMREMLEKAGVSEDDMRFEEFPGY